MDARLHWVEVLGHRFPVVAKTRQAALVTIVKKIRREAKVGVASMQEVMQAGRDGLEILGGADAETGADGPDGSGGDADDAGNSEGDPPRERRVRSGGRSRRALGSHSGRAREEGTP